MSLGNLVANLGVNRSGWTAGLRGARSDLRSFAGGVKSLLGPLAGIVGGTLAAGASISAAQEQIKQERKLEAVLKATAGAAGLSANEIKKFAAARQDLTNFGDEATIAGAAVLGTFKNITGDVFKDSIVAMQDMAAVMGSDDLKGGAIQLGKALNDPIRGVSALADVGVSFTDEQRNMIRTLQESGDLMGAQRIILDELKGEFGGAAAAMADPMIQAKNALGDVAEIAGFVLLPSLNALFSAFTGSVGPITGSADTFKALGQSLGQVVADGIQPLATLAKSAFELLTTGADLFGYAVQNAGDLSMLALLNLGESLLSLLPISGDTAANLAGNLVGAFEGMRAVAGVFIQSVVGGFQEMLNVGRAVAGAIAAAFKALLSGENPLEAFTASFVETLAQQKDVVAPNIADVMQDTFADAKERTLNSIREAGGVENAIGDQRAAILERLGNRERPGQTDLGELATLPNPANNATTATETANLGPAGLLRGSQETLERLRTRDLQGGQSEKQKQAELAKSQLKSQQALETETKQQTAVLRRIAENLSIETGGFD